MADHPDRKERANIHAWHPCQVIALLCLDPVSVLTAVGVGQEAKKSKKVCYRVSTYHHVDWYMPLRHLGWWPLARSPTPDYKGHDYQPLPGHKRTHVVCVLDQRWEVPVCDARRLHMQTDKLPQEGKSKKQAYVDWRL